MSEELLPLLQKIANNTDRNDSLTIAIVAGSSGVLGAALTALCGYLAVRKTQATEEKRLRASIVTTERLRWLHDVRQRLARFYVKLDMQYNFLKRPVPGTPEAKVEYQKALDEFSNEVNEQCNIISLMMNPDKPDQNNLKNTLQDAIAFVQQCVQKRNAFVTHPAALVLPVASHQLEFDTDEYKRIKTKAFDSLTKIGVATWNRVKGLT